MNIILLLLLAISSIFLRGIYIFKKGLAVLLGSWRGGSPPKLVGETGTGIIAGPYPPKFEGGAGKASSEEEEGLSLCSGY